MTVPPSHSLDQRIRDSLRSATAHRGRLGGLHARCTVAGLVLGALATFFAGFSSLADGPVVGDDWRLTCTVASLFTLAATIVSGVQGLVVRPERLTQASECVGRLRALLIDAVSPTCDWEELRRKYQQILIDHAGVDL